MANTHMNLELWPLGFSITADQTQGLNPLIIILFTPALAWIWRKVDERTNGGLLPTDKMIIGFGLTVVAMVVMAGAGWLAGAGKVSIWYLVLATFLITMGNCAFLWWPAALLCGCAAKYEVAGDRLFPNDQLLRRFVRRPVRPDVRPTSITASISGSRRPWHWSARS